jgi:hypothetical protein
MNTLNSQCPYSDENEDSVQENRARKCAAKPHL